QTRVGLNLGHPLRLRLQELERGESRGSIGRRDADAKQEAGGGVLEIFDHFLAAGDVSAATAEGLAESSHPEIDISRIDGKMLADPAARLAQGADGVGFVD